MCYTVVWCLLRFRRIRVWVKGLGFRFSVVVRRLIRFMVIRVWGSGFCVAVWRLIRFRDVRIRV